MTVTLDDLKGVPEFEKKKQGQCANEGATRPHLNKQTRERDIPEKGGKSKNI